MPPAPPPRARAAWGPLLATAAVVVEAALPPLPPRLPILATLSLLLLVCGLTRWRRDLALLALAATLVEGSARARLLVQGPSAGSMRRAVASKLAATEERKRQLVRLLEEAAGRVASLPEARAALGGDRPALSQLFLRLEQLRGVQPEHPAMAVHAVPLATLAWSGRVVDLRAFEGIAGVRRDVFVLAGSVTTTLLATAPLNGPDGRVRGLATAELPLAVRRNIHNEFLSDFDRLAGDDPSLEIRYLDARYELAGARPFAPLAAGLLPQETLLRAPDGGVLAAVRAVGPVPAETAKSRWAHERPLVAAATLLVVLAWTLAPASGTLVLRLAVGATALRAILLVLGSPLPGPTSPLLSPDVYASTALGPLTRSPLDLLLTAAWLLPLALLLARGALAGPARPSSHLRACALYLAALPLLGGLFAWLGDTSANSSLDVETLSLLPPTGSHLAIQVALLAILAAGAALLVAVLAPAGPLPRTAPGRAVRAAGLMALGLAAYRLWPREILGLPLAPALALFLVSAVLAATREAWVPALRAAGAGMRAGLALAAIAFLSLLLYPSLAHYGEKDLRQQIEREHAPLVLHQPQWREYVLAESRRKIDELGLLEEAPPGPPPPVEELAFAAWSATDLAAFGFSSAVEIQDPGGRVVSRFALNLPSLALPRRSLPASDAWETLREELPLASGGGRVLHSRRLLTYHAEAHGAVHLYVKDDYWNLPFVRDRDPYSVLYRTASRGAGRERPIGLHVYDRTGGLVFSSAERPPTLDAALRGRLAGRARGLWTTLTADGRAEHTFVFADAQALYGLSYPRIGAGHFAADVVEAVAGMTLLALAGLLAVMLLRTLLRRDSLSLPSLVGGVRERFSLRLFVAMIALAVVPMLVLDVVVRGFVVERLRRESEADALERAAVAKKAVEGYVTYRGGEAPGRQPSLEDGLVYVASLMRNDLDLFARGRLLASSKAELYASGLLPPRVSGAVYRALILEAQPAALATERIGGFSYLAVSVPVHLDAPEPGILSIPLALRQREVAAVLADLDRTIRLASVLFLVVAAGLAHSMSRRISGPIRDLTSATQAVARGDLSARVAATSRDELKALVDSFNQMARDLERQRQDLERSNRLAAWAELARQVAHEVKNPLTPIQLSAEHLRRVWGDRSVDFGGALEACTETILKQVQTLRGIVTEFSAFARPPAPALEPQDLRGLVAETLTPYRAVLPAGVSLGFDAEADLPPVLADRRLIERAVVNLVENALQAVGDAGAVSVRLRSAPDRVEVEVEDSGPGVDPDLRQRVFEPFFSTKTAGSGLGLALVRKIAEDHGGGVTLDSRPGETRVRLWLPAAKRAAEEGPP